MSRTFLRHRPLPCGRAASVLVALLAFVLAGAIPAEAKKKKKRGKDKRPNIVLVVTDDQTLEMMNTDVMPETIQRIGRKGTTFSNAVVTTPLCCPSRATMLTGQYGHNNGVLDNKYRLLNQKRSVLPVWMRKAGYSTLHVGRYLNGYERAAKARTRVAFGWDQWHSLIKPRRYYDYTLSVNGGTRPYGAEDSDYLTSVLTDRATRLINRFGRRKDPFFLQYDHFAPHVSGGQAIERCMGAAVPGPLDEHAFETRPLPRPPSFDEADVSDKPSFIRNFGRLDDEQIENLERRYRCALGSLREVDRGMVEIDRALKEIGEKKRTVVIFLSDNGFYYGEHRLPVSKNYPYQEGIHVPLMIRAPKKYLRGERQPRRVSEPVANIDIAPTILALADAKPCKKRDGHRCRTMDGRSLLPLLRGEFGKFPNDRGLVIELDRGRGASAGRSDGSGTCDYRGLKLPNYAYFEHTAAFDPAVGECVPIDERELYNLIEDPFQLESQAIQPPDPPPAGSLQEEMAGRLAKLHDCKGLRGRDKRTRGHAFCE